MATNDRLSVVLAAMADIDGDGSSIVDRVCLAAVSLLSLTGAAISLLVDDQLRGSVGASDAGISIVQELQLSLGQGPCQEAWATDEPVMEPDLADPNQARWPSFAHAGVAAGIQAVFAFPLRIGSIKIGVLACYRGQRGMLSAEQHALGLVLADVAGQVISAIQAGAPERRVAALLAGEPAHWAEVHQATGMIAGQLGVSMDEAFVRLRARAFAEDRPLRALARDVTTRRQQFNND